MSPFDYLQFGVCFVSFIFEQMSSFNVDSTYDTDVMETIFFKKMERKSWYIECMTISIWSNDKSKHSETFLIWSNNHKNQLKLHKVNLSKYCLLPVYYIVYYYHHWFILYTRKIDIYYIRVLFEITTYLLKNIRYK